MNPYQQFVTDSVRLVKDARAFPLGGFAPAPRPNLAPDAPKALFFAPHPDDETIVGALALRIFREAKPLKDPGSGEILGYEAPYVGAAEYVRQGETRTGGDGKPEIVPATFVVTSIRQEANVGDRLAPVVAQEFMNYAPHPPGGQLAGQIVSIYGDALTAGQNQIVSLNRGAREGVERGHVLALVRDGSRTIDSTDPQRPSLKLPDERHGMLFVFRVFDRMSYALILSVKDPVKPGDKFTQP